ncbi:MAG: hypothetical protein D6765_17340, partial [Bacteroidetes bacterium]
TEYGVRVETLAGCVAEDAVVVWVDRRLGVYVRNAFSPDGDGINDRLVVYARRGVVRRIRSFRVFTRWGSEVYRALNFEPNDEAVGWDGRFRGRDLDVGVYVWWAEVELVDGTVQLLKGDVVLLR